MLIEEKILPNDIATERTLLATMMCEKSVVSKALDFLTPADFYVSHHQIIFAAIKELYEQEKPVDIITLSDAINDKLESVGGSAYLAELMENPSVFENAEFYIKIILEKSARRKIISLVDIATGELYNPETSLESCAGQIESVSQLFTELCDKINDSSLDRAMLIEPETMIEKMVHYNEGGILVTGENCGWENLYKNYRPARGTLNIITGIPTHGKSELMDAIAVNLALYAQWRWCIFSPENYPTEIHLRKIIEKYIGKNIQDMSGDEIKNAMLWINQYFRFVQLSESAHHLDALIRLIDKPVKEKQFDAVIIDPWNELDVKPGDEERETNYIGRSLSKIRRYSRRHNIAAYIVAHPAKMYRNKNTGEYDVPTLYDINGSAHWYNKADNGLVIYREKDGEGALKDEIQLHIQKIKFKAHGNQGLVILKYNKDNGRFYEEEKTSVGFSY
jgi:DnaB-like helicase N terminal domain/DnaB-like helicase C terminal domain